MVKFKRVQLAAAALLATLAMGGAAQAQTTQSATGSITIVEAALTVTKTSDLVFGAVVKPGNGTGTVQIEANNGNVQLGGGASMAAGGPTPTRAAFEVEGVPSRNIQVTTPSSFTMTRAGGTETLNGSLYSSMGGGQIGSGGTVMFYVGGQVQIPSSTVAGAYTGNFTVTVAYN